MATFFLFLSIVLSSCRNILSKQVSETKFGTRAFFQCQGILFLCGTAALLIFGNVSWEAPALLILMLALMYGMCLILGQWCYTIALSRGNIGTCSTVYSLGFILPTLSGAVFWREPFSVMDGLGVMCAVFAVAASGYRKRSGVDSGKSSYIAPLVVAMIASGGLGIVQKLQQKCPYAEQKSLFLLIAFLLSAVISLIFAAFSRRETPHPHHPTRLASASGAGICFGCCNLLNTTLAGLLPSAVFFPTLNIGVILLSLLLSICIFKEHSSKKDFAVLLLGGLSILLLNLT